mmetsp:Transcript_5669/g.9394  ORF Transcript_5669/g.9394 Transcript_5669/m.9394 type:complete len:220 (-) Transcript_5669:1666-2325(-)
MTRIKGAIPSPHSCHQACWSALNLDIKAYRRVSSTLNPRAKASRKARRRRRPNQRTNENQRSTMTMEAALARSYRPVCFPVLNLTENGSRRKQPRRRIAENHAFLGGKRTKVKTTKAKARHPFQKVLGLQELSLWELLQQVPLLRVNFSTVPRNQRTASRTRSKPTIHLETSTSSGIYSAPPQMRIQMAVALPIIPVPQTVSLRMPPPLLMALILLLIR